jgi:hypothetical protein
VIIRLKIRLLRGQVIFKRIILATGGLPLIIRVGWRLRVILIRGRRRRSRRRCGDLMGLVFDGPHFAGAAGSENTLHIIVRSSRLGACAKAANSCCKADKSRLSMSEEERTSSC